MRVVKPTCDIAVGNTADSRPHERSSGDRDLELRSP